MNHFEVSEMFGVGSTDEKWNPERNIDWKKVKMVWRKKWDLEKPVLLEKSPHHMVRFEQIKKEFQNSYFILLYRNPYAILHSILNKTNLDLEESINEFLNRNLIPFWQIFTESMEKNNILYVKYKDLENLSKLEENVTQLLELEINLNETVIGPNSYVEGNKFNNMNKNKISKLTSSEIKFFNDNFFYPNIYKLKKLGYTPIK